MSLSIQFWFVCKDKECRKSFSDVNLFIEHKKEKHFTEFQGTKCFVFDEREKPLFPSQDESCISRNSIQFLVTKEKPQAEFPHYDDASAIKIEAESWAPVQTASILHNPLPLATATSHPSLFETYFSTNNNLNNRDCNAGTEHLAFAKQQRSNYHIASPSQNSNFDALIDADVMLKSNLTQTIDNHSKNADKISDVNVTETKITFSGNSSSPDEHYLEIIPKTELFVFESECDSVENAGKITDIKDNANNGIKIFNNPHVRLKRLTKKETQSASSSLNCRQIKTFRSAQKHPYPKAKAVHQLLSPKEPKLRFKCNLCCDRFESVRSLKLHWNSCSYFHDNRHSFCVICNKLLLNSVNFEDHCLTVHRLTAKEFHIRTKFKCQLCAEKFEVYANLSLHTKSHSSNEPSKSPQKILHKCTEPGCAALFALPCLLNYHMEFKHTNNRAKQKYQKCLNTMQ